jgi:osmotically-inducible protein OsmY
MLVSCASRVSSFDDARIAEDVTGVLRADHIDGVSVYVKNGRVTLVGVVDTQEQSVQARRDAERVDGVASVTNDIETRKP